MSEPTLYGASYSVYVRAVQLALIEKGVGYQQVEVDVFAADGPSPEHRARHPFSKIPAFDHNGFELYETGAITRYIDEAFAGPPLQPSTPRERARMNQVIGILDSYAYRTLVWDIYVERVSKPREGKATDEARVAAALPHAERCLRALAALQGAWLAGDALTLADLHAAPMFAYFVRAPEAAALLDREPGLRGWWERIAARRSMQLTAYER